MESNIPKFRVIEGGDALAQISLLEEILKVARAGRLSGLAVAAVQADGYVFADATQKEGGCLHRLLGAISELNFQINDHINKNF